jgi:1-acyl-sn-glycerol-3-phosphate acyltransferase
MGSALRTRRATITFRSMRTVLVYATIFVLTITFGVPIVVASALGVRFKPNGLFERIPRIWARSVIRASGSKITLRNPHVIERAEARVYISNHVSWFDVFALASVLPRYRFVAKKELFKIPLFGPAVREIAGVFIDRQNRKAAFDAYATAASQIKGGASVVVFPEGTRGRSYALRPFKKGPFVLAIAAQQPVVPVVVYGTREIQPRGVRRIRSGTIEITFLEPIATSGMTYADRERLMQAVWDRMAAALERHGVRSAGGPIDTHAPVA